MNSEDGFTLFGPSHLITLAIIVFACFMTAPFSQLIRARGWSQGVAYVIAVLLGIYPLVKAWLWATQYGVPWERLLPLQICDANVILCAIMLFIRSYRLYEVAYFWSIAGSVAAMLTPDLRFDFPHPSYISFFFGHGLTVIGALYATFVFKFRPQFRSLQFALSVTFLYALAILPLNFVLDTNYLYLMAKPSAPSILDYLGPWPWYLLGLILLTIITFLLCYAPFAVAKRFQSR